MQTLRAFGLAVLVLALAACGTSQGRTFTGQFDPPPAGSRVLVMTPDVQLALLTAAGLQEPREDWSRAARDNLGAAFAAVVQADGHSVTTLDPTTAMEGRIGQIIRLHDAVGGSMLAISQFGVNVPTRRDNFEWTLGEGTRELAQAYNADYALFVTSRGSYASAGRVVAMIGLAALGVGIPLGGQQVMISLVDLRTGNVIWFNFAAASSGEDMREAAGAQALVARIMQGAPL